MENQSISASEHLIHRESVSRFVRAISLKIIQNNVLSK